MGMTMTEAKILKPATEMVKANNPHVPNESKEYRQARHALVVEEIESSGATLCGLQSSVARSNWSQSPE